MNPGLKYKKEFESKSHQCQFLEKIPKVNLLVPQKAAAPTNATNAERFLVSPDLGVRVSNYCVRRVLCIKLFSFERLSNLEPVVGGQDGSIGRLRWT